MRFLEGTLSFNAGFSSILTAKNYEFWRKKEAPRYFLGKYFESFSGDPYHKARKATCLGKLRSLTFYSFSLQDLLKGFIQVLLHFYSLGYSLKMVEKTCLKMASKSEKQKWKFLGKMSEIHHKKNKISSLPPYFQQPIFEVCSPQYDLVSCYFYITARRKTTIHQSPKLQ